MALGDLRIVERGGESDHDRVVRLAQLGWVAGAGPDDVRPIDQALRAEESDGQLGLVARGAHRDGDGDRFLARPGGPDLQRRLSDDPVVADLERLTTNGHDPAARDVADRRLASVAHGRMIGGW